MISGIIKVEVSVISRSRRLRLITLTEILVIPDITKTESNNCFIIYCFEENSDKRIIAAITESRSHSFFAVRELDIRELKQRRFWAADVNRKFIFLLLARFHAPPMSYKALILTLTTWLFEWKGLNTHQRGEVSTSGWLPWLKKLPIVISGWPSTSVSLATGVLAIGTV